LQRAIVNIPRVSTHPFLRILIMDALYLFGVCWPLCCHSRFQGVKFLLD